MVEAVKHHILNMLHLSARPNLTQPVPRAALLNAIKKLHVGRVAEDGSVEIQEEGQGPGAQAPSEPPSEIITFAELGESNSQSASGFTFMSSEFSNCYSHSYKLTVTELKSYSYRNTVTAVELQLQSYN